MTIIHCPSGRRFARINWKSLGLINRCIVFSPANIAVLGRGSPHNTSSICESMREPGVTLKGSYVSRTRRAASTTRLRLFREWYRVSDLSMAVTTRCYLAQIAPSFVTRAYIWNLLSSIAASVALAKDIELRHHGFSERAPLPSHLQ